MKDTPTKKFGKTIKLFLIDGDPNGLISCELSNWSGMAYKIPRFKIKDCSDRKELTGTGVYLLFGKDDDGKELVYIGEAESISKRLNQQLTSKNFWNETIVFLNKDNNLNKAHVKYLENRLHDIAKSANRYKVENSIIPTQSSISESDKAEMEEYIEHIKMLVNTLGHKVLDTKRELGPRQDQQSFFIKAKKGVADGQGVTTSEGFVVFKGSRAAIKTSPSISSNYIALRKKLINEGVLIESGEFLEFTEDWIFSSPSTAASVVLGRSENGLSHWKLKDGKTLKEFESSGK